nr:MAG TPA: hypothetical protein [Caudoviricetes sp.]
MVSIVDVAFEPFKLFKSAVQCYMIDTYCYILICMLVYG